MEGSVEPFPFLCVYTGVFVGVFVYSQKAVLLCIILIHLIK